MKKGYKNFNSNALYYNIVLCLSITLTFTQWEFPVRSITYPTLIPVDFPLGPFCPEVYSQRISAGTYKPPTLERFFGSQGVSWGVELVTVQNDQDLSQNLV